MLLACVNSFNNAAIYAFQKNSIHVDLVVYLSCQKHLVVVRPCYWNVLSLFFSTFPFQPNLFPLFLSTFPDKFWESSYQ
jgi:hypothetical protein